MLYVRIQYYYKKTFCSIKPKQPFSLVWVDQMAIESNTLLYKIALNMVIYKINHVEGCSHGCKLPVLCNDDVKTR